MRRLLALSLICAPVLLACVNSDPAPLFIETSYQVRCIDCLPRAVDDPTRDLLALNGENGFVVSCNAQRAKDRLLTFSASLVNSKQPSKTYSIELLQADLDKKDPGSSCRLRVVEGMNTYEGHCTADAPTADLPCQVKLSAKNGVVKGTFLCDAIPNRNDSTVTRHVTKPGTTDAASFQVDGCTGL